MDPRIEEVLHFWFGDLTNADLPHNNRTELWFGAHSELSDSVKKSYLPLYEQAVAGQLTEWNKTPRGRLAFILLVDQFARCIYTNSAQAFDFDVQAQALATDGVAQDMDQSIALIERVFFYIPLVHAENLSLQEQSIQLYQELVILSLPETKPVYQLFLTYAYAHYKVIKDFGRFPQRNRLLSRETTPEEQFFLTKLEGKEV